MKLDLPHVAEISTTSASVVTMVRMVFARIGCVVVVLLGCSSAAPSASRGVGGEAQARRSLAEPAPTPEPPEEERVEAASLANGRALVVPGADGFLSTWRHDETVVAQPRWRMELAEIAGRGQTDVTLTATLLVPHDTHAFVMTSTRGAVAVELDSVAVGQAQSEDEFRLDLLLARLDLPAGEHALAVRFTKPERGAWRGAVRLLSARHGPGPGNVALAVGELDQAARATRISDAVAFDEERILDGDTPSIAVRAHLPGGGLREPVEIALADSTITLSPSHLHAEEHRRRFAMPDRGDANITVSAGAREERAGTRLSSDRAALRAAHDLGQSLSRASDASRGPIAWRREELFRAVRTHDADRAWRRLLASEAPSDSPLARPRSRPVRERPRLRAHGFRLASRRDGAALRALRPAQLSR